MVAMGSMKATFVWSDLLLFGLFLYSQILLFMKDNYFSHLFEVLFKANILSCFFEVCAASLIHSHKRHNEWYHYTLVMQTVPLYTVKANDGSCILYPTLIIRHNIVLLWIFPITYRRVEASNKGNCSQEKLVCVCVYVVFVCVRMCALVCTSTLPEWKNVIEAEAGVMVSEAPTQAVCLYSQSTPSSQPCPQGISI